MKTVQLLLIFLAGCVVPAGATNKVDSLKQILENHTAADKAEVLWCVAYELFDVDNPQALFYAERAYEEVWAKGDSLQIVKVGTTYGQLLRRVGKLDMSIEVSSRLLPIARRHDFRKYRSMLLNSLGLAYQFKEEFSKSLGYVYESLILRQAESDTLGILVALQNLGFIHYRLADFDLAHEFSLAAIRMYDETTDSVLQSVGYMNFGIALHELGEHDSAKYFLRKSLLYTRKSLGAQEAIGSAHITMALAQFATDQIDSAKYHASFALAHAERQNDKRVACASTTLLSRIYFRQGDLPRSAGFLKIADSISTSSEYVYQRIAVVKQKAIIATLLGRHHEAVRHYEEFTRRNDSIYDRKHDARVRRIQLAFKQHENSAKINAQSAIMSLQQKAIGQQKIFLILVTSGLLAVITLTIALQRANRKIRLINEMLDQRVVERTRELGYQRDALQHLFDEQLVSRLKFSKELTGITSTILGLVHLAKVDISGNTISYLNGTYELTNKIKEMATNFGIERRSLEQVANYITKT